MMGRKDDSESGGELRHGADSFEPVEISKIIQELEEKEEYRLAIRWMFIQSLRYLKDLNLITWDSKKTNQEVVRSIKDPAYKAEFEQLIRVYEYIWYGAHEMKSVDQYQKIKRRFDKLNQAKRSWL
jgi:hypothetical protein